MEPTYLWTSTGPVFRDKWIAWDTQASTKILRSSFKLHYKLVMDKLNSQSVDDTRIALKERTIITPRTVKDVVNKFDNVDRVQVKAHASYTVDLESVAQAAQDQDAEALTKFTKDKKKQMTEIKKIEIGKRQHEGEKLIAEASERLAKATSCQMNTTGILAAQAYRQLGIHYYKKHEKN